MRPVVFLFSIKVPILYEFIPVILTFETLMSAPLANTKPVQLPLKSNVEREFVSLSIQPLTFNFPAADVPI